MTRPQQLMVELPKAEVDRLRALIGRLTLERDSYQRTLALALASASGGGVLISDHMRVAYDGATITSWHDPGRGVTVLRGSVRYA